MEILKNRPNRPTQCCIQFKSPRDMILFVLYLHYNVAFTFKWYRNSWNKTFYSQRVWIGTTMSYPFGLLIFSWFNFKLEPTFPVHTAFQSTCQWGLALNSFHLISWQIFFCHTPSLARSNSGFYSIRHEFQASTY